MYGAFVLTCVSQTMNFTSADAFGHWDDPNDDLWGEVELRNPPRGGLSLKDYPRRGPTQRRFKKLRGMRTSAFERAQRKWARDKPAFQATQAARARSSVAGVVAARLALAARASAAVAAATANSGWYNAEYIAQRAALASDAAGRRADMAADAAEARNAQDVQNAYFRKKEREVQAAKAEWHAKHGPGKQYLGAVPMSSAQRAEAITARAAADAVQELMAERQARRNVEAKSSYELLFGKPTGKFTRPK